MLSKDTANLVGNVDADGNKKQIESPGTLIAEKLQGQIEEQLESGDMDLSEIAGTFALSSLLIQQANGLLDDKQEFSFLQSLADKKTKSPVQKIEATSKVDFKVSIADAINNNAPAYDRTLDRAKKHNQEILDRLSGNLMLDGESGEEVATTNPGEPNEIQDLRNGGDGSKKIISWRDRIDGKST